MKTLGDRIMEKRALIAMPMGIVRAMQAGKGEGIKGFGEGYLKGTGTEVGALLGALSGAGIGGLGGLIAGGKRGGTIGSAIGGAAGLLAGGYGGYKLSDFLLRQAVGEEKYKEIFDAERERKVKDNKVVS